MLYLIGAGLKPEHLTIEALEAIKKCDRVFLDTYTSMFSDGNLQELEKLAEKKVFLLARKNLEEESGELLSLAKSNNAALLVIGNPLTATTHIQLVLDAHSKRVQVQVIPGISITNFLAKTGLDEYRFGRTCTIPEHREGFEPESFYDFILANKKNGLHSLCLLDTGDGKNFLSAAKAVEILEKIEKSRQEKPLAESTFVVLAGAGGKNEQILWGNLTKIRRTSIAVYPQSLIVCGNLNEKEQEALGGLYG
ncbi:MAG: diphthine synthase [archaeon]